MTDQLRLKHIDNKTNQNLLLTALILGGTDRFLEEAHQCRGGFIADGGHMEYEIDSSVASRNFSVALLDKFFRHE